jgi:hypothetical protein
MSANRSAAVMQQRIEPPDSLDYFPTPPWATRALCKFLKTELGEDLTRQHAWEPACGEGHMARPLAEYFQSTTESDCHPYRDDGTMIVLDFLLEPISVPIDWIVTNPPFQLGEQFIHRARRLARRGVAMFVRSAFTESGGRYRRLFAPDKAPPAFVLQFVERVVLLKGRLIQSGAPDPFSLDEDGHPRRASSATSYCWLVWICDDRWTEEDARDTRHVWLGTPRAELERPGDYPAYTEQWAALALKQRSDSADGGAPRAGALL